MSIEGEIKSIILKNHRAKKLLSLDEDHFHLLPQLETKIYPGPSLLVENSTLLPYLPKLDQPKKQI